TRARRERASGRYLSLRRLCLIRSPPRVEEPVGPLVVVRAQRTEGGGLQAAGPCARDTRPLRQDLGVLAAQRQTLHHVPAAGRPRLPLRPDAPGAPGAHVRPKTVLPGPPGPDRNRVGTVPRGRYPTLPH